MPGYRVLRRFATTLLAPTAESLPPGTARGQKCQKRGCSLGSAGVGPAAEDLGKTPARAKKTAKNSDAGGGTRTPDTRIMMRLSFGFCLHIGWFWGLERGQNRG